MPAEECLFVDDMELNCEAARELGFTAVQYRDADQAIAEIRAALARRALALPATRATGALRELAPAARERQAPAVRGDQAADLGRPPRTRRVRFDRAAGPRSSGAETSQSRSMSRALVKSVWSPAIASRISRS